MSHDVFVSYSSKDKAVADAACATLEARGIRCWIAPRDILPGKEWGASIIEAIRASRVMVLIFSEDANQSRQIRREVNNAVERGVAVLPIRIQDVMPTEGMEYYLDVTHWLDALTPPLEDRLQELANKVELLLNQPTSEAAPPSDRREPSSAPQPRAALTHDAGGRGNSFWVNRKRLVLAAAAILLAGAVTAAAYLMIRRARPNNSSEHAAVMDVVNTWAETIRARDLDNHLRLYADRVSPFYGIGVASREKVRATYQAIFAAHPSTDVRLDKVSVELTSETEAKVTYDNTYNWSGGEKPLSGKSHDKLTLSKVGTQWLITGEQHIQDYYQSGGNQPGPSPN